MNELIKELEEINNDITVMVWCLNGGQDENESVESVISVYSDIPERISNIFSQLIEEYGNFNVKENAKS